MTKAEIEPDTGSQATPEADFLVHLTDIAAERIKATMAREGVHGYGVRIGVVGGGCSGFQYELTFEPHPRQDDVVWDLSGVRVFVDSASKDHLRGITLDYVTGLHAAGFKFINPNATRSCGCGSSFGV
jgi:iron-sulfur cluster assembly accessory protein